MKYLVTGAPGSGKSTMCRRLVEVLVSQDRVVGGMISGELREKGVRVGFEVLDVKTGKKWTLAHVDRKTGPSVGRYRVDLADLEGVGVGAIRRAVELCDVVVIDEIGPMELKSSAFIEAVKDAFASPKDVVATIHLKTLDRLVVDLGLEGVAVIKIDEAARERALDLIMGELTGRPSTK